MVSQHVLLNAVLLIAVSLSAGCGSPAEPPVVGELQAQPSTTITTGETASLTISVSGKNLEFEWSVLRGHLSDSTQVAVIYTAPESAGPDIVTVRVRNNGGEIIKSINLNVVASASTQTSTPTSSPAITDTPTATPVPDPIACNNVVVTKNVFPQLASETGQFPIYGPVTETRFLCEAVYDIVHDSSMAIHIKYENVGQNFGWWGVATPNGYNAGIHKKLCFWAYTQAPNQSFRFKMKDTARREKGIDTTIETPNQWQEVCADIGEFAALGIQVEKMDNVNLGFEAPYGSAEVWVADFEFK